MKEATKDIKTTWIKFQILTVIHNQEPLTKYSNTYINITFKTSTDDQNVKYVNGNDKNFKTAFTTLFTIQNSIANNTNVKKTSYSVASIRNQSVYWCKANKNIP